MCAHLISENARCQAPPGFGMLQVETRPLMLVEAATADKSVYSTLLQNAETVRLLGPAAGSDGGSYQVHGCLCQLHSCLAVQLSRWQADCQQCSSR